MMDSPAASFRAAAQTGQTGAGIIAARRRGGLASADALLDGLDDRAKAAGFLFPPSALHEVRRQREAVSRAVAGDKSVATPVVIGR